MFLRDVDGCFVDIVVESPLVVVCWIESQSLQTTVSVEDDKRGVLQQEERRIFGDVSLLESICRSIATVSGCFSEEGAGQDGSVFMDADDGGGVGVAKAC